MFWYRFYLHYTQHGADSFMPYRTRGFIHDTLFSRISRKLLDSWKFNSWTATSQVKCIISYWNKEGSLWKFKRELSACNRFVKISHREKYPAYGIYCFECGFVCYYQHNKFVSLCRLLDCGNHICERVCHEGVCESCALLPDHVTHCPCGSTPLMELLTSERTSCLEPIPTCTSQCGKLLPCSTPGTAVCEDAVYLRTRCNPFWCRS